MKKNCENCQKTANTSVTIPYFTHESEMARMERHIKRMWIALLVCITLIFASNVIWVWNFYDFYTKEVVVDNQGDDNANYIGQDGDVYDVESGSSEEGNN